MPIENRKLKPGTVLVARYKGAEHRAEVVKTTEGLRYKLKDGREFKSPSSAGVAVKGEGKTCDGWEFWSVEGAPPVLPRAKRTKKAGATPRRPKGKAKAKANAKSGSISCGECKQEFPNSREAAEHMAEAHGAPEAPGNGG